jgi:NAD(P)-dependent dehydrogenase (short-subunit alcohol dehydrogenase family)
MTQAQQIALITGGANGIGAAVARRLAGQGWTVVIADVQDGPGTELAAELGGHFQHLDVSDEAANHEVVAAVVEQFGGLDFAFLNAGVSTGTFPGPDFDAKRYRRAMSINLDGVVYGAVAAVEALRRRGGGNIIATASLAGLTAIPMDPLYGANKHAVVGLIRGLGPAYLAEGIRINAVCPSFADTAILAGGREELEAAGFPVLSPDDVADAVLAILAAEGSGECWFVQYGRPSEPFAFRGVPGPVRD